MKLIYLHIVYLFCVSCNKLVTENKNLDNDKSFTIPWDKFYIDYRKNDKSLNLNNLYDLPIQELKNNKVDSIDPYLLSVRKYSQSEELFYYAVLDTVNCYSIVYKKIGDYGESYDLVNYSKDYKIIDFSDLSFAGGDADFIYFTKSYFMNDSTVVSEYVEGYLEDIYLISEKDKIEDHYKLRITSKKNGKIKVDTIR